MEIFRYWCYVLQHLQLFIAEMIVRRVSIIIIIIIIIDLKCLVKRKYATFHVDKNVIKLTGWLLL